MSSKKISNAKKELSSLIRGATSADKMESHLVGALSAVKLESHVEGATSADKMESHLEGAAMEPPLEGATAADGTEILGSYVEVYHSPDEMKFRMSELYAFMTKPVKMFENLNPDGYIDVFKRMEIKYRSSFLDESAHEETKLGILVGVFEKYLICRLPKGHIKGKREGDAIKYIVEAMVSSSCDKVEDFTINDIWKLMITAYTIRLDPSEVLVNEMTWFGIIFTIDIFITQVFRKISYFGEFLYFCTAVTIFEGSPLDKMISMCNDKEVQVVESIRRNMTPELGISTFIVYRNWISDSFPNTRENMEYWVTIIESKQGFGIFHDAYLMSLETLKISEVLLDYFNRFIIFLGSEASSAPRYFDLYVLSSEEFLNGLRIKKGFMLLSGINKYLLKMLQFFVDVLLCLYDADTDTICFEKIPKFFKIFWSRSNCKYEFVATYIYDAALLMDFVFIDQFHKKFTRAYYDICVAISDLVIDRFKVPDSRKPLITEYCLFPFFDVQNAE